MKSAGKRPLMKNWETRCAIAEEDEIRHWSRTQRHCTNTGLLCGEIVGLDIDVPVEHLAAEVEKLARELMGTTFLKRIGRAPKLLLAYRAPRFQDCSFLFTANGVTPFSTFSHAKRALDAASGVTGWRLHDLRRTARSLLSRAEVNPDIAERCLGHALPGVRGVYDRHKYLVEMRRAFEGVWRQRSSASFIRPRAT